MYIVLFVASLLTFVSEIMIGHKNATEKGDILNGTTDKKRIIELNKRLKRNIEMKNRKRRNS